MQNRIVILTIVIAGLLSGCGSPKVIPSYHTDARQAEVTGNFEAATGSWQLYFDQQLAAGKEIAAEDYAQAAKTAYKAGQTDLSLGWFEQAQMAGYESPEIYLDMAEIFKQNNDLPKEIDALEKFREHYPDQKDTAGVNTRLFERYTRINEREKAADIWASMRPEDREKEKYLDEYFSIQKQLKNNAASDSLAKAILEVNPEHVKALEWLGNKYYQRAEERYQREMKKYEEEHTHLQHFHLVQELKTVTADFKKALSYFSKLWEINQDPYYAPYLVNIYTRFENTEKADFYRKYLK